MSQRRLIKNYNKAVDTCRNFLLNKSRHVIVAFNTTGIGENDVIIQIGIIDLDGNILLDSLIKPTKRKRMFSDVTDINEITFKMLAESPTFIEIYDQFKKHIIKKVILCYNNEFQSRLLEQTAWQDGIKINNFTFYGLAEINKLFRSSEKYTPLNKNKKDQSAIGTCNATLKLINKIAESEKMEKPKWWRLF